MNNRTLFLKLSVFGIALSAMPLSGCSYIKNHKAKVAYGQYQTALAQGDLGQARNALQMLVHTDQDVPDYWIELGKLQLQMADYRGAYDSFSHAHELDRTNVDVLSILAQMALLSGDMDAANENADSLALIDAKNPTVITVRGYRALQTGELDKADAAAVTVLANAPMDPLAKILQSRVLLLQGKPDQAVAVLEDQYRAVPNDRRTIKVLSDLYRSRRDWRGVARMQWAAHQLDPKDPKAAEATVEALLRAGDVAAAARLSNPMLGKASNPQVVDDVLNLWSQYAPKKAEPTDVAKLASVASGDRRVSFARYFNAIGRPDDAVGLLGGSQLPVSHENARWNAVVAQALAQQGRTDDARRLFDLVLAREPDQVDALRGRSALEAKFGPAKQAIIDAQRLVTASPASGQDRLLLARAYLAAGNHSAVRSTLWQAFQDLPDDERVYAALRSVLASTGDVDGQRRLEDESADRRKAKLTRDLV